MLWKEIRRALRPRYEDGERVSPLIPLGYDHITEGYSSPQRLTVQQGSDWGALGFAANSEDCDRAGKMEALLGYDLKQ